VVKVDIVLDYDTGSDVAHVRVASCKHTEPVALWFPTESRAQIWILVCQDP
jgi:hypothetical protein